MSNTNQTPANWNARMLVISIFLLLGYNLAYLAYRLGWLGERYIEIIHDNIGLFTVLEFLAVVSLAVDVILRWDRMPYWNKRMRLTIAILMALCFGVKLVAHIMALYTEGGV
jgi:hypothetical protein